MRPGFAAILYQPARADIAQLHQALPVKAGIDWIEDLDRIPAYVIYQDTGGHLHQLYSLLEKPAAQEGEEGLPDSISGWLDQAEHTPLKSFTNDSSSLELLVQAQCKTFQFRACLKNVNMPNLRVFCPLDGAIFP